ncbi:hypothetical protein [Tabrizicola sp. BL-A-41-H6]|uniref:hypothetical protein n=1 Tax=Tabrizicola sp. BL-A-41-H6 TaxID=3421107 RepID=UPI003D66C613
MNEAETALGPLNAKELITIIADIEAQENAEEMLVFMDSIAQIADGQTLVVSFGSHCHARFVPVGTRFQRGGADHVVWSTVERLKLIAIEVPDAS